MRRILILVLTAVLLTTPAPAHAYVDPTTGKPYATRITRSADIPEKNWLPGHRGVDLALNVGDNAEAAHQVALQIAAMKARFLKQEDVPADVIEKERAVQEEITRNEGKPEAAIAKIVEGRMGGFFKDVVLLDQPSLSDSKKSVKQFADEAGIEITDFVRFEVGQA